jgi:myo-inositol 2-dehydrogenase/D-chiro-inositol 1-dehydrogenase
MKSRIRIGIAGLGRLGKQHARNLALFTQGAEVVAACSVVPAELDYAKQELGIAATYADFDAFLAHKDMQAVVLVTPTNLHSTQVEKSLLRGLHVFCEKPLALDTAECERVAAIAASRPKQVVTIGFVRRFDPSHVEAKKRIEAGEIGRPFLLRTQTADTDDTAAFQVRYSKTSGGIFFDMNVHDVDLVRWLLGAEIESVYSAGGCYAHPGFAEFEDADNTSAMCRMSDGSMACISASRTMMHGHDTRVEIVGTKGTLRIGDTPRSHEMEIRDRHGVRVPCLQDFYQRFEQAFRLELQDFVDCVLDQRAPRVTLADAVEATRGAHALRESYRGNRLFTIERP